MCNFVDATIGKNPSYMWHSILVAQQLVKAGLRWRVRNGANIRIWQDKWLPSPSTYRISSPRLFLHSDTRVQYLINATTTEWKATVIETLFLPHEAEVIKSIPISSRLPPDKIIWTETRNGLFMVRNAYKLAVNQSFSANRGTSSDTSNLRRFWRRIWSMQFPHKICHFVWQACRDALSTKQNLLKQKIIQEEICEGCKEVLETIGHVLWGCPRAREVWECSKLVIRSTDGANLSFQDIMWNMLLNDDVGDDHVVLIATIAWALWHNRNETRYGGIRKSGQHLSWASDYLLEYRAAVAQNNPAMPLPQHGVAWYPPWGGHFKINVDGATFL